MISNQPYEEIRVRNYYAKIYSESTYIRIQSQYWVGGR